MFFSKRKYRFNRYRYRLGYDSWVTSNRITHWEYCFTINGLPHGIVVQVADAEPDEQLVVGAGHLVVPHPADKLLDEGELLLKVVENYSVDFALTKTNHKILALDREFEGLKVRLLPCI